MAEKSGQNFVPVVVYPISINEDLVLNIVCLWSSANTTWCLLAFSGTRVHMCCRNRCVSYCYLKMLWLYVCLIQLQL